MVIKCVLLKDFENAESEIAMAAYTMQHLHVPVDTDFVCRSLYTEYKILSVVSSSIIANQSENINATHNEYKNSTHKHNSFQEYIRVDTGLEALHRVEERSKYRDSHNTKGCRNLRGHICIFEKIILI